MHCAMLRNKPTIQLVLQYDCYHINGTIQSNNMRLLRVECTLLLVLFSFFLCVCVCVMYRISFIMPHLYSLLFRFETFLLFVFNYFAVVVNFGYHYSGFIQPHFMVVNITEYNFIFSAYCSMFNSYFYPFCHSLVSLVCLSFFFVCAPCIHYNFFLSLCCVIVHLSNFLFVYIGSFQFMCNLCESRYTFFFWGVGVGKMEVWFILYCMVRFFARVMQ